MSVTSASIRDPKNRLAHYLRLTRAGGTVEITDRGEPRRRFRRLPSLQPAGLRLTADVLADVRSGEPRPDGTAPVAGSERSAR